jgi:hypothetical protein
MKPARPQRPHRQPQIDLRVRSNARRHAFAILPGAVWLRPTLPKSKPEQAEGLCATDAQAHYNTLYSLLTTHYSLLTTHYSLLTTHCLYGLAPSSPAAWAAESGT